MVVGVVVLTLSTVLGAVALGNLDMAAFMSTLAIIGVPAGTVIWATVGVRFLKADDVPASTPPLSIGSGSAAKGPGGVIPPYFRAAFMTDLIHYWRVNLGALSALSEPLGRITVPWLVALWPLTLAAALLLLIVVGTHLALAGALTAVMLAGALAWRTVWMTGTPLLRAVHRARTRWAGGHLTCTEGSCLRSSTRPHYRQVEPAEEEPDLDLYPSSSGVFWVRDERGNRYSTLPFWGRERAAVCPHCRAALGTGRDRHRLLLAAGPSTENTTVGLEEGLSALLKTAVVSEPRWASSLGRVAEPLHPGTAPTSRMVLRIRNGAATTRLLCCPLAAEYLHSVEQSALLPLLDDCQSLMFIVTATRNGKDELEVKDPENTRQCFNVLRQRLVLHGRDPRTVRLAVAVRFEDGGGSSPRPAELLRSAGLDALLSNLEIGFIDFRLFGADPADPAAPLRWLTGFGHAPALRHGSVEAAVPQ